MLLKKTTVLLKNVAQQNFFEISKDVNFIFFGSFI